MEQLQSSTNKRLLRGTDEKQAVMGSLGGGQTIALTVAETARETRLSKSYIHEIIGSGKLPSIRIGRRRLVLRTDLIRWLNGFGRAGQ
jgi:excisionase family DNA binding protein